MIEITEEKLKKRVLKDYYKLKEQFKTESDEDKKLKIIHDIVYLNEILDSYLFVYDDEYQYDIFRKQYLHYFKKTDSIEEFQIDTNINDASKSSDIIKKIYINSKRVFNDLRNASNLKQITPTEISKKQFYDVLLNIPIDDFNKYLFYELKNQSLYIENSDMQSSYDFLDGRQYAINTLGKNYHIVESILKYSYLTMFPIVHEITHSYVEQIYDTRTNLNLYKEVVPIYHEIKLMGYLKSINSGVPDVKINNETFLDSFEDNLMYKSKIKKYKDLLTYSYVIGPILAFYFFEIDKKDPEKAKYLVDNFCSNLDNYDPYELLQKLNIDIEQLTSGETTKRMVKFYQK